MTVSFFEWVQNLQNFRWEEEEVNKRLDRCMTEAFAQIWEISRQKKLPLRTAAFVKALQSVTRAHLHSKHCVPSSRHIARWELHCCWDVLLRYTGSSCNCTFYNFCIYSGLMLFTMCPQEALTSTLLSAPPKWSHRWLVASRWLPQGQGSEVICVCIRASFSIH